MKKIFTLIAITMVAICANAQTLVSFGGSDANNGYEVCGSTTETTTKIHTNTDAVACLKLANGYSSENVANGNDIKLTTEGGFKTGDVVSLAGATSVKEEDAAKKRATAVVFTKDADNVCTKLTTFSDFINGRISNDEPVVETYTLEADADVLYIGRDGNTGACITYLTVTRGGDTPSTEPVKASEIEGVYNVIQTGTTWFTTDWSAADLSLDYNSTVTIDGTKVSLSNIDGWADTYVLSGDYDETTNTITFAPTTMSWYTAAGSGAKTDNFTATVSKDGETIKITFKPWSFWYGDYSYENTTSMIATRTGDIPTAKTEWEKDVTIAWVAKDGSTYYSGKGKIACISGVDYQYEVTGVGSNAASSPATVQFSVEDGVVVLKNGTYDSTGTGGYWYNLLQEKNDDAWFEGGDGCTFTGNETEGTCKFCYWYYTYDEATSEWSKTISEGYVTITWNNSTAIKSVSSDNTTSTLYDLQGRVLNAAPAKGMYIQNGKKYLAK